MGSAVVPPICVVDSDEALCCFQFVILGMMEGLFTPNQELNVVGNAWARLEAVPKDSIHEVVVLLCILLRRELLVGVAEVNVGASEVHQSMLQLRAVRGLDWASVGGDIVVIEANSLLQDCRCAPGLEPVDSHLAGAQ